MTEASVAVTGGLPGGGVGPWLRQDGAGHPKGNRGLEDRKKNHNGTQEGSVPWGHCSSPSDPKPWRMNRFCVAFLRCILMQVVLPE